MLYCNYTGKHGRNGGLSGVPNGGWNMDNLRYRRYYLVSLAGVVIASVYPLYMGIKSNNNDGAKWIHSY